MIIAVELITVVQMAVPILTSATFFAATMAVHSSRQNRSKIEALTVEVALLKQQISPFWASLQTKIADALHHPGLEHRILDGLLEKLESLSLTPEEQICLENMLEQLRDNAASDVSEKAETLLAVMPMVVKEASGLLPSTDLRTIEQKKEAERVNGNPQS